MPKTLELLNLPKRSLLIKKLDKVFSDIIRQRDNWTCVRCGHRYQPPTRALHCSHFFSRRYLGTRWDLANCDSICYGCHRYVESMKMPGAWYYEFKKKQLGEEGLLKLEVKALGRTKFSRIDLEILLESLEEKL